MKVYIASHDSQSAESIAIDLLAAGIDVGSTWHRHPLPRTASLSGCARKAIAISDIEEIDACDAVLLESGPEKYAGGKFVEAGYALGRGKTVVVLGRRENLLLWHPSFLFAETVEHAVKRLTIR